MRVTIEVTADLLEGMAFQVTPSSGHAIVLDAAPDVGGAERGPRPIELVLMGLAGCTGMDVISILRKMRQDVSRYQVRARGERAIEHPRVYTAIVVEHVVHGRNLNPDQVRRAVELSATRYCPVSAMLRQVTTLEERYRIVDEATGKEVEGELDLPEQA